jgi:glycosyltransferase involved in cell wall biosynthesis
VPEIIEHGVSGFIVDNETEAMAALSNISTLDRGHIREAFERRFTTRRMTNDYLSIYNRLVEGGEGECADGRAVA